MHAARTLLLAALVALPAGAAAPSPAGDAPGAWTLATADGSAHAGYEVALHARDPSTALAAYKQPLEDPDQRGYVDAALRVARTTDGGESWDTATVDPHAPERGRVVEQSVAVDGHGATVHVAYLHRESGRFADMALKVATSTDGGATWTARTVVDGYAGDHVALAVPEPGTVVALAHGEGFREGLVAAWSTDDGASWTWTRATGADGAPGLYASAAAEGGEVLASHYRAGAPGGGQLALTRGAVPGGGFATGTVAREPGAHVGLASSLALTGDDRPAVAHEVLAGAESRVQVAVRAPDGEAWRLETVDRGPWIGWDVELAARPDAGPVLAYWDGRAGGQAAGQVRVATRQGAGCWPGAPLPAADGAEPYLDADAAGRSTVYVAFRSAAHDALRVARGAPAALETAPCQAAGASLALSPGSGPEARAR